MSRRLPAGVAVLRLLPRAGRGMTCLLAVVTVVAGTAPAFAIITSGLMVQAIVESGRSALTGQGGHRVILLLSALALLFVLSQGAARLATALAAGLGSRLDAQLQRRAIAAVNGPAGVAHLDDPDMRDQLSRITGIAMGGYTPGGAVGGLTTSTMQVLQSLTAFGAMCWYRWWLGLLVLAAGLWWSRESRSDYLGQTSALAGQTALLRRSGYLRDLILRPSAAKEVRLFGLTGWLTDRFRSEWDDAMEVVWRARVGSRALVYAALVTLMAVTFSAYALLALDAVGHVVELGTVVTFLRAVNLIGQASARGQQDLQTAYGLSSLPAVAAIEDAAARVTEEPGIPALPGSGPAIAFRGVTFRYPGTDSAVLENLDLVVPASTSLAIVGVNGAGKSTLIKLLCRFYDPDAGEILVDGADLRHLRARDWQRRIAAVFQDFQRFDLPARENVGFGAIPLLGNEAALRTAAERAGILDRIESLPRAWDTPLARHLDGGADLSGGEWQRIALARALLAVDAGARILILDEPTASLDTRAESAFYDRFLDVTKGVTTIIISHRFSTVRRADSICVLSDGSVVELGTHPELVAAGGQYARMYAAQSDRFAAAERTISTSREAAS